MALTKDNCYKKGLLGTTIIDVSKQIANVEKTVEWLNVMYELAADAKNKSEEKGMNCLRKSMKTPLNTSDYKNPTTKKTSDLLQIINKIEEGSKRAWTGRTKQGGFKKNLAKSKYVVLFELLKERNDSHTLGAGIVWEYIAKVLRNELTKNKDNPNKLLSKLNTLIKTAVADTSFKESDFKELLNRLNQIFGKELIDEKIINILSDKIGQKIVVPDRDASDYANPYLWLLAEWGNATAYKEDMTGQCKPEDFTKQSVNKVNNICKICTDMYKTMSEAKQDLTKIKNDNVYCLRDLCILKKILLYLDSGYPTYSKLFENNVTFSINETTKLMKNTFDAMKKQNPEIKIPNIFETFNYGINVQELDNKIKNMNDNTITYYYYGGENM